MRSQMQELVFEILLDEDMQEHFPVDLLERASIVYLLRFGAEGFASICQTSTEDWRTYERETDLVKSNARNRFSVKSISEKSGTTLLHISGSWFDKTESVDSRWRRYSDFFRSMERASIVGLEMPFVLRNAIKYTVVAEPVAINQLLKGLQELNIPHKIRSIGRLSTKNVSVLNELTQQQRRILKLAHAMGYYDIPRRTRTEDLARMLGMDKATIGEHLRRAERNVFNKLLS